MVLKILSVVIPLFFYHAVVFASSPLTITEIMADPKAVGDSEGEWFEVYNPSDQPIDLSGVTLKDNGKDKHTVTSVIISPKSYVVLCRNSDSSTNGGVGCTYSYSQFNLANKDDEIILEKDGTILTSISYTSAFSISAGKSIELSDIASDVSNPSNWHDALEQFGSGDYGTPGKASSPEMLPSPTMPAATSTPQPTSAPKPTAASSPTTTVSIEEEWKKDKVEKQEQNEEEQREEVQSATPLVLALEISPTQAPEAGNSTAGVFFGGGIVSFIAMCISAFYIRARQIT
jgi:hypothetical protein